MNLFTDEIRTDAKAQEFARQWIAALRSGKYVQGTGALRTEDGTWCCLGVACNEANPRDWYKSADRSAWRYLGFTGTLPSSVQSRLRLSEEGGSFGASDKERLANLNDDGASFAEIANVIERELEAALA